MIFKEFIEKKGPDPGVLVQVRNLGLINNNLKNERGKRGNNRTKTGDWSWSAPNREV